MAQIEFGCRMLTDDSHYQKGKDTRWPEPTGSLQLMEIPEDLITLKTDGIHMQTDRPSSAMNL